MVTKPLPFQMESVLLIERRFDGRVLLADDMGLGKTFQSLYVMYRNKRYMTPCLVICPSSLKPNWQREALNHVGMDAEIIEGRNVDKHWKPSCSIVIINYDILDAWLDKLLEVDFQLVILDECHRIKDRTRKTFKTVRKICRYAPYLFALSGSPLTNHPAELYTSLNLLWPDKFNSFFAFAQKYTKAEHKPWGWKYSGARNLDILHRKLKRIGMIRRLKTEVLDQFPQKLLKIETIRLNRVQREEYNKAQDQFLEWLCSRSYAKAKKAAKAQAIVKMNYLRQLAAELKMRHVHKWIDKYLIETNSKLLVFGVHKEILGSLHKRYKGRSILINGEVTGNKREQALRQFKKYKQLRIAFLNMRAGGVGLNMQEASDVLFIELPWVPADIEQSICRAHRMGQQRDVNVYVMITENTIEDKLFKLLQKKQRIFDHAIDGRSSKSISAVNIFDALEAMMLKEKFSDS